MPGTGPGPRTGLAAVPLLDPVAAGVGAGKLAGPAAGASQPERARIGVFHIAVFACDSRGNWTAATLTFEKEHVDVRLCNYADFIVRLIHERLL